MFDPVTLTAVSVGAAATLQLAGAGAEWLVLQGRTSLVNAAAALPPGSEVGGSASDGRGWMVRTGAGKAGTGDC
jgi:hypothetical protein